MSLFNPNDLLNENIAANDTKRSPLPVGETVAQIMELKIDEGLSGPKSKNPGTPWYRLNLKLEITDPAYLAEIPGSPDKAVTYLGIMLDMQDGRPAVGPNKNIRLGKLRDATGTNGKPLNNLMGQFLRISIGHKPHHEDPESVVDEIVGFTKA